MEGEKREIREKLGKEEKKKGKEKKERGQGTVKGRRKTDPERKEKRGKQRKAWQAP